MKIFISQPMNGKCDKEILKAKESALYKFNKYLEHNIAIAYGVKTFYINT